MMVCEINSVGIVTALNHLVELLPVTSRLRYLCPVFFSFSIGTRYAIVWPVTSYKKPTRVVTDVDAVLSLFHRRNTATAAASWN